ncbi:MAG: aromatic acid/H+ symport family MFS transporter [Lapillicoccus sp.]
MASPRSATTPAAIRSTSWIRALCWSSVMLEGFDIVALSAALPTILETKYAGIGPAEATFVTTISLVGIMIGSIAVGPVADRLGRRLALMGSIALFSVFTLFVPLAPNAAVFGLLRLVAGIGLGACLPAALTMMSEITAPERRARAATLTMTGYHIGAVLTSLLAIVVAPSWQILFVVGGLVGLLVLPVMWVKLPETNPVLIAETPAPKVPVSDVLKKPFALVSIATWVASFMGLLLVYGLNSWLPTIMKAAGYALGTSLTMLLLLNLGGVVGLVVAGMVGDARGIRVSAIIWFGGATVLLGLLSIRMPTLILNAAVFLTGLFVFSAQVLIYAYITRVYPPQIRGTALGLAAGIGRIGSIVGPAVTGALVTAGLGYPWGFYFFCVVALLAVVAMVVVPRGMEQRSDDGTDLPAAQPSSARLSP